MHERTVDYCRNRMEWATSEVEYDHWKQELEWARLKVDSQVAENQW